MKSFVPYYQWPEYDLSDDIPPTLHRKKVGQSPRGKQWGRWPLYFEEYAGDEEPQWPGTSDDPPRIVAWRRYSRTDIPPGWLEASRKPSWMEGYADISADYRSAWSESARRDAKKWRARSADTYQIGPVSFGEFARAYLLSQAGRKLSDSRLQVMSRKMSGEQSHAARLVGVRHAESGELAAGMGIIDSKTHRESLYYCGFFSERYAQDKPMTGLIDHWFESSQEKGFTRLHFGQFWIPGESPERRGFSNFKAKFGITYVVCRPPLWRLKPGKLF
jgi:hypothetical protein